MSYDYWNFCLDFCLGSRRRKNTRQKKYYTLLATLKSSGKLNEKYAGGIKQQATYLKEEGFIIEKVKNNKPPKVKDFEKYLI